MQSHNQLWLIITSAEAMAANVFFLIIIGLLCQSNFSPTRDVEQIMDN